MELLLKFNLAILFWHSIPFPKTSSLKSSKFGADVVLSSINHLDMNGVEQVTFGEKKPFVISGPGEYEVKEVFIKGLPSQSNLWQSKKESILYML